MACTRYLQAAPARIQQTMHHQWNTTTTQTQRHPICSPSTPRRKNALKHFSHQVPVRHLKERVEFILHLVHLPELDQEPEAAILEPLQPVQVPRLEPLDHVPSVDVLEQALEARLLEVGDVILVRGAEEGQPVREELLAAQVAVDVVEEAPARVEGHVGDVDRGELLLLEVVREHAPEDG